MGLAFVRVVALMGACDAQRPSIVEPQPVVPLVAAPFPEGTPLVNASRLPLTWTLEEGYAHPEVDAMVDANGDDWPDALVRMKAPDEKDRTALVLGPLVEPKVLPQDAVAWSDPWGFLVQDLDGDGIGDAATMSYETQLYRYVAGPLVGELDFSGDLPTAPYLVDFDGDGVGDWQKRGTYGSFEVWYGPELALDGPPDLSVDISCPGYYTWLGEPAIWPDLTGDGLRDGHAWGFWGGGDACNAVYGIPRDGLVTPFSNPANVFGMLTYVVPVPDQTGDGAADVWLPETHTLLAAPVTFTPDGPVGDVVAALEFPPYQFFPQPLDLTGDGLAEVLFESHADPTAEDADSPWVTPQVPYGGVLLVVKGGADGLTNLTTLAGFDVTGVEYRKELLLLDGHAWLVLTDRDGVGFVDLGPAVAVPLL